MKRTTNALAESCRREILRNDERNNNSPETRQLEEPTSGPTVMLSSPAVVDESVSLNDLRYEVTTLLS